MALTMRSPDSPGALMAPGEYEYRYDNMGNRISFGVDVVAPNTPMTYVPNDLNQYDATVNPAESFDYDEDGNLKGDGDYTYDWDGENRLVAVTPRVASSGKKRLTYEYDYMNRRVRRTSFSHNGSGWVEDAGGDWLFVYDRWNVALVLDANNSNQVIRKYTWGLDLGGWSGSASVEGIKKGVRMIYKESDHNSS